MKTVDLTPLYRSSIGFDRLASLLDASLQGDQQVATYPPYNIEVLDENHYGISLAVAGFERDDLAIEVENSVLTIKGQKADEEKQRNYLYRGIANRNFERAFNLEEHVKVVDARLNNGLLTIDLIKEIPETMKPKSIPISDGANTYSNNSAKIEHSSKKTEAA